MKNRIRNVYLALGQVLNHPESFGLTRGVPGPMIVHLSAMQRELLEILQEEALEEDFLSTELSQDADPHPCRLCMITDRLQKTGS